MAVPAVPQFEPNSELTPLLPNKLLYLEKGAKERWVHLLTEVCLREGMLEVLLCKSGTKEHEAILRTEVDARLIHAALVAAGLKPGTPVQYVDPKTGDEKYQPATGAKVAVTLSYLRDGQAVRHPAQEWIQEVATKKPMPHQWVFAGSRFVKNPERPMDPDYYCANNGEVIGVSNFPDSMLDLPVSITGNDDQLAFAAWSEKIPPLKSRVWISFSAGK